MSIFDPQPYSGTVRTRVRYVAIEHPVVGPPTVLCVPQRVIESGAERIEQDGQGFYLPLDHADPIPELEYTTGQPTGRTLTMGDVQNAINSAVAWGLAQQTA